MKTPEEIKKGLRCCGFEYWEECDCDYCPYAPEARTWCNAKDKLREDALALIQQLEAKVPKWISVKTPPKKPGEYIVLIRYPDGRSIRTFNIFHPDAGWCPNDLVEAVQTHWMPFYSLPEPPKEYRSTEC